MRRVPRQHRNQGVRRERDGRALRRQIVLLACGLTLACGFVLAVGQHYAAVRYGYHGEQLREERKHLLAERDRLLLELSAAESPVTLEQAARQIGMQPARPSQMGTARPTTQDEDAPATAEARKAATTGAGKVVKAARVKESAPDAAPARKEGGERAAQGGGDTRPRFVTVSGEKVR
jgi:cell division protein FtsL